MGDDLTLKDRILLAIASHYPFPADAVRIIHNQLGSFDLTIQVCEMAQQLGESDIIHQAQILERRKYGPGEVK